MKSVVWFKRDLRVKDHSPLSEAAAAGSVIPLYIHEPSLIAAPDFSAQHGAFARECLDSLGPLLARRGAPLIEMVGEAIDVLARLRERWRFDAIHSHRETGNWLSYERDKAVGAWCRENGVRWVEHGQNGVLRGTSEAALKPSWFDHLERYTSAEPIPAPGEIRGVEDTSSWFAGVSVPSGAGEDKPGRARGGRAPGFAELKDFFGQRIGSYPKSVSSPLTAERGGSRLSPYLSFGVISAREVVYGMNLRLRAPDVERNFAAKARMIDSMRFYADRLKWRSAYLQSMESLPELEFRNIAPNMDGLREAEFDAVRFAAWKEGRTGYPMVDAAMRMLIATGWINMRMRGMLMSFASNELWLHWREPGLHLARHFLDYEPGIHYNQLQIHACVAGGSNFLSYNPIKQAMDLDPIGVFVRRWVPELGPVEDRRIFEPWKMTLREQSECGVRIGEDYPIPIVNHVVAGRTARDRIAARRKSLTDPGPGA